MKIEIKKFAELIKTMDSVLIFAHKNPDGDAIGSAVCAGLLLKECGIDVDYCLGEDTKGYLSLFEEGVNFKNELKSSYDAALLIDTSTPSYVYDNEKIKRCDKIFVIDHHISNEGFGDYTYHDSTAGATGELIYQLAVAMQITLTKQMAHAVYLSIIEDTGNFTYSNTTGRTHQIVSHLYEVTDDFYTISEKLKMYPKSKLLLTKIFLDNVKFYYQDKMIIASLFQDSDIDYLNMDTDGLINMIRQVRGCILSVFIKELAQDTYKISMRSADNNVDVASISSTFGGGGHKKAAGFQFHGQYDELIKYFLEYAEKLWMDS